MSSGEQARRSARAHPQAQLGLGDLIRAFAALDVRDEATRQAIATLILPGLRDTLSAPEAPAAPPPTQAEESSDLSQDTLERSNVADSGMDDEQAVPTDLVEGSTSEAGDRSRFGPALERSSEPPQPVAREPLFRPHHQRSILYGLASMRSPTGALDIDALVEQIAERQVFATLPLLLRRGVRSGVTLVIDEGHGMTPFLEDQNELVASLCAVVGKDRVKVVFTGGAPRSGGLPPRAPEREEPRPIVLPPEGTSVLAVTDLGIGRRPAWSHVGERASWAEWARVLRRRGCSLVVLLPYPRQRWPRGWESLAELILWDRATTPSMALFRVHSSGPKGRSWPRAAQARLRSAEPYPDRLLSALAQQNPQALELARLASLTTHIEPGLLRRLRYQLLPQADVSAEVDLWLSPLVLTSGSSGLVLLDKVVERLRTELAKSGRLLEAWSELRRARRAGSPLMQLEEELVYYGLRREIAATGHAKKSAASALNARLRKVLAAMSQSEQRARDLSAWAARALPRLPEVVRSMQNGKNLSFVASARVAAPPSASAGLPSTEGLRAIRALLPRRDTQDAAVRRVGTYIEMRLGAAEPGWHSLKLPRTTPLVLVVEGRSYELKTGLERVRVYGEYSSIESADGRAWSLITSSAKEAIRRWLAVAEGPNGERSTALVIGHRIAVTSSIIFPDKDGDRFDGNAHFFSATEGSTCIVRFEGREHRQSRARLVAIDVDMRCALLELDTYLEGDPPRLDQAEISSTDGLVWGYPLRFEGPVALAARVRVDSYRQGDGSILPIEPSSRSTLMEIREFGGGPVVQRGRIIGFLTISASSLIAEGMACSASGILDLLAVSGIEVDKTIAAGCYLLADTKTDRPTFGVVFAVDTRRVAGVWRSRSRIVNLRIDPGWLPAIGLDPPVTVATIPDFVDHSQPRIQIFEVRELSAALPPVPRRHKNLHPGDLVHIYAVHRETGRCAAFRANVEEAGPSEAPQSLLLKLPITRRRYRDEYIFSGAPVIFEGAVVAFVVVGDMVKGGFDCNAQYLAPALDLLEYRSGDDVAFVDRGSGEKDRERS